MDPITLVRICKAFVNLGSAVQDQVEAALDGRQSDCNGNALEMIRRWAADAKAECQDAGRRGATMEDVAMAFDEIECACDVNLLEDDYECEGRR